MMMVISVTDKAAQRWNCFQMECDALKLHSVIKQYFLSIYATHCMGLWVYHGVPNWQFLSSWEIQPGDRMTLRCLWGIQLEMSRRQFREESGLEKVLKSFSQRPWTYISESIQSWRNHQEFSSRLRPCISHDTQSKPPQYPVSLCRALLQGEHGRGSSLGDGYLPQWTGAPASWLPANGVSHDCSHLIRDSCSRQNWADTGHRIWAR